MFSVRVRVGIRYDLYENNASERAHPERVEAEKCFSLDHSLANRCFVGIFQTQHRRHRGEHHLMRLRE